MGAGSDATTNLMLAAPRNRYESVSVDYHWGELHDQPMTLNINFDLVDQDDEYDYWLNDAWGMRHIAIDEYPRFK